MNKTDKLKDAMQYYDKYGTDPDNIMMLTTEEWAKAKDEKIDIFDEDEIYLNQMMEAIAILDEKIRLVKADIEATERLMQTYHNNYQMKYEYQKELNELNHSLLKYQSERSNLFKEYVKFKETYEKAVLKK